ncbi:hypothetical protein FGO68_gene3250 [Halteria grandinella]|uniref:Uncharacterized protein n=1 Tax=Halteria grandinella TaxID=5974 RepID=A0A8J8NGR5_HALGN|nr:hypothetical protein FGO68_gene3250 [Halteria grandinella]
MKQNFNMKDLILIGHYLSLGCEGEHSFWTYFEDSVITHSSQLTSQSLIVVLEALQRRVRRSVSVWTALESELEPMIPQLSPDELIRVIRIFNAFKKEHTLWPSFNDAICSYEQLSKEQVYDIMKLCHEDDRKRRVWVHFLEKFLIKKGYFLQYSYQELKLIESWIKASGKMNSETEATFGLLYKVKNPKIKD